MCSSLLQQQAAGHLGHLATANWHAMPTTRPPAESRVSFFGIVGPGQSGEVANAQGGLKQLCDRQVGLTR